MGSQTRSKCTSIHRRQANLVGFLHAVPTDVTEELHTFHRRQARPRGFSSRSAHRRHRRAPHLPCLRTTWVTDRCSPKAVSYGRLIGFASHTQDLTSSRSLGGSRTLQPEREDRRAKTPKDLIYSPPLRLEGFISMLAFLAPLIAAIKCNMVPPSRLASKSHRRYSPAPTR